MPSLYEMGLPIVETGDKWHVSVGQKVPLNRDRNNVRPAFLRAVRTLVLNEMHERLTEEDANDDVGPPGQFRSRTAPTEAIRRGAGPAVRREAARPTIRPTRRRTRRGSRRAARWSTARC